MCGIFGTTKTYENRLIEKKLLLIKHRGPDYYDFQKLSSTVTFGQVRLSIIDLNKRSNQPFTYGDVTITYNGEVYNFKELKRKLQDKGYDFNTTSDTEVLCAMYLEYGEEMVAHLNGMFAFAIFDKRKNTIFGARDRMGQKPFYYSLYNNEFEFSSQISPLRIGNNLEVNRDAIKSFLEWGYVPEPQSMYKDVFKLKASHSFTYDIDKREFSSKKYADLTTAKNLDVDYNSAKSELDNLLNKAVNDRLISDVPLGVFLSGGVDSSLMAALAQKNSEIPIKTFSVGFNESKFDESNYAEMVAKHIGSDHQKIILSPDKSLELLDDYVHYFDEPFFDTSAFGQMLLTKETKKQVTVALTGDGGDELFLGYNRYQAMLERSSLFKIPYPIRILTSSVLNLVTNSPKFKNISQAFASRSIEEYYLSSMSNLDRRWLAFEPLKEIEYESLLYGNEPLVERIARFETRTYMNGDIHTKVDRSTMKYSLEARSPLMDHRIVDFALSLPIEFKLNNGVGKRILKDVLYDYVPREIFERKKTGFGVPIGNWFRAELKDWLLEIVSEKNLDLIPELNKLEFLKMVDRHLSGKWDYSLKIWSVVNVINWLNHDRTLNN